MPFPALTRTTLSDQLTAAGVTFTKTYDKTAMALRFVINGEALTPGQAAERHLPSCTQCTETWPLCPHA